MVEGREEDKQGTDREREHNASQNRQWKDLLFLSSVSSTDLQEELFEQEDGQLENSPALKSESQEPSEEEVLEASDGSESEHDEIVEVIET